jgi:membrane protease YdiL (CAAX protease family)
MTSSRKVIAIAITLVVGAALLGASLARPPGDTAFYPLLLAVAATWVLGAVISGPVTSGRTGRRHLALALALGAGAGAVVVAGGALLRLVPDLQRPVVEVLAHADSANVLAVGALALLNGVAEEMFFRGAVFAAFGRRPILWSTAVYVLATLATANPMLTLAAAAAGPVFGWQRLRSGGFVAPALTHVAWTAIVFSGLSLVVGR